VNGARKQRWTRKLTVFLLHGRKLVEYQQELEAKVEERTKDLLEKEQSLGQNQELHKTNAELDRFVYSTRMICVRR
jgi:C4-dicarboxylate-specific signal transduction histidine kinase